MSYCRHSWQCRPVIPRLSSILVLTQNGNFWVAPVLDSVSDMCNQTSWIKQTYTDTLLRTTKHILWQIYNTCIWHVVKILPVCQVCNFVCYTSLFLPFHTRSLRTGHCSAKQITILHKPVSNTNRIWRHWKWCQEKSRNMNIIQFCGICAYIELDGNRLMSQVQRFNYFWMNKFNFMLLRTCGKCRYILYR